MAFDWGRSSLLQLSMSKSFCSSVSFTAEYTLPPKVTAMVRSAYSSKTIGMDRSLRHAIAVERQDAFDLHRDRVVLGALELVDALLLERARNEKLLLHHSDRSVHELLRLNYLVLNGGNE
jgi:hypothetical protein